MPGKQVLFRALIASAFGLSCASADLPRGLTGHASIRRLQPGAKADYQPITGAMVTLYQAGTEGYGSTPKILATALSDSQGNFNIVSFTCDSPASQLYVSADQGNGGVGNNTAIDLVAILGPCQSLPSFVDVNELSTIAAAYALSHFMNASNPEQIGSPSAATTNPNGINNAVSIAITNLVDTPTGLAAAFLSTGLNSPATLNSLAAILVPCVESSGPASADCTALFSAATPVGGSAPVNTLQAALNIALNPVNNVSQLFTILQGEQTADLPYTPVLTTAPTDWTLYVFLSPNLSWSRGMAIDAGGNAWIANATPPSLTKLSPVGAETDFYSAGFTTPEEPAIDQEGDVWVTNIEPWTVAEVSSSGTLLFVDQEGTDDLSNPLV